MLQVADVRSQIESVKEEASKLAAEYNKADNGKDDGYVALLHSVPEELSYIGLQSIILNITSRFLKRDFKTH